MNDFQKHYLICALWASNDQADESGGEPLDANYDLEDFSEECLKEMLKDCDDFYSTNEKLLKLVSEKFGVNDEQHGHDFWLTRNGHGAGFWDRSYGRAGELLTDACKPYGSVDLYVGDDGKIYC